MSSVVEQFDRMMDCKLNGKVEFYCTRCGNRLYGINDCCSKCGTSKRFVVKYVGPEKDGWHNCFCGSLVNNKNCFCGVCGRNQRFMKFSENAFKDLKNEDKELVLYMSRPQKDCSGGVVMKIKKATVKFFTFIGSMIVLLFGFGMMFLSLNILFLESIKIGYLMLGLLFVIVSMWFIWVGLLGIVEILKS